MKSKLGRQRHNDNNQENNRDKTPTTTRIHKQLPEELKHALPEPVRPEPPTPSCFPPVQIQQPRCSVIVTHTQAHTPPLPRTFAPQDETFVSNVLMGVPLPPPTPTPLLPRLPSASRYAARTHAPQLPHTLTHAVGGVEASRKDKEPSWEISVTGGRGRFKSFSFSCGRCGTQAPRRPHPCPALPLRT